jgi:hypothetical protein
MVSFVTLFIAIIMVTVVLSAAGFTDPLVPLQLPGKVSADLVFNGESLRPDSPMVGSAP